MKNTETIISPYDFLKRYLWQFEDIKIPIDVVEEKYVHPNLVKYFDKEDIEHFGKEYQIISSELIYDDENDDSIKFKCLDGYTYVHSNLEYIIKRNKIDKKITGVKIKSYIKNENFDKNILDKFCKRRFEKRRLEIGETLTYENFKKYEIEFLENLSDDIKLEYEILIDSIIVCLKGGQKETTVKTAALFIYYTERENELDGPSRSPLSKSEYWKQAIKAYPGLNSSSNLSNTYNSLKNIQERQKIGMIENLTHCIELLKEKSFTKAIIEANKDLQAAIRARD